MKLDAKNLRINSITLIVLTVLSAISLVGRILANQISTAAIMERGNITEERAGIYVAITISVSCLLFHPCLSSAPLRFLLLSEEPYQVLPAFQMKNQLRTATEEYCC